MEFFGVTQTNYSRWTRFNSADNSNKKNKKELLTLDVPSDLDSQINTDSLDKSTFTADKDSFINNGRTEPPST
jgi:hypothetical protein